MCLQRTIIVHDKRREGFQDRRCGRQNCAGAGRRLTGPGPLRAAEESDLKVDTEVL